MIGMMVHPNMGVMMNTILCTSFQGHKEGKKEGRKEWRDGMWGPDHRNLTFGEWVCSHRVSSPVATLDTSP